MSEMGQGKLYYLYMMADGELSAKEKELYNKICKKLGIGKDEKKLIAEECTIIWNEEKMTCMDVLKKNTEEVIVFGVEEIELWDMEPISVLWNLINIGYADSVYTEAEKEVVQFLKKHWKIPEATYCEMVDIAETCLALEEYKKWAEQLPDSDYREEKLKQVRKDLRYTQDTIKTIISEKDF